MLTFQFNYLLVTLFIRGKINRMCGWALGGGLYFQDGSSNSSSLTTKKLTKPRVHSNGKDCESIRRF